VNRVANAMQRFSRDLAGLAEKFGAAGEKRRKSIPGTGNPQLNKTY